MTDPLKLTIDTAVEIEGREDTAQLTVQAFSDQAAALQVWEDSGSNALAQMSADGLLQVAGVDLDALASAPANPASGEVRLYAKNDGKVYARDSGGVEYDLTSGGSGGSARQSILIGEKSDDYDQYSSGWNTRVLTHIVHDETSAVTLSNGEFVLPAGTYYYRAVAQAYGAANAVLLRLYNVSDAQPEPGQHRVQAWADDETAWVNVFVWGKLTLTEAKTFRLEQYHGTANGYGRTEINVAGELEYHAFIELERKVSGGQSSGSGVVAGVCAGRLSFHSTDPQPVADITVAQTLYLLPHRGSQVPLFDGVDWGSHTIPSNGISLSLSGLTANVSHDVFLYDNSGTLTLEAVPWKSVAATNNPSAGSAVVINVPDTSGVAVGDFVTLDDASNNEVATVTAVTTNTNITVNSLAHSYTTPDVYYNTRATALSVQDGVHVKSGAVAHRFFGTLRTTASAGQSEDSKTKRFLWNYHNPLERELLLIVSGQAHSYSGSFRPWTWSGNKALVEFVVGLAGPSSLFTTTSQVKSNNVAYWAGLALGFNSESVYSGPSFMFTANYLQTYAAQSWTPPTGYNRVYALEGSHPSGTGYFVDLRLFAQLFG